MQGNKKVLINPLTYKVHCNKSAKRRTNTYPNTLPTLLGLNLPLFSCSLLYLFQSLAILNASMFDHL